MRIIFMGSPDFAVPTLDAVHAAGHDILAVYTQPPRPAGRGKQPSPTAVAQRAATLGLPVHTPASLKGTADQATLAAYAPDALVVAAYGLLLPQAVLDIPVWDSLNVHASLLPRWRGAAPIQRAILAGDAETGVTIMAMEAGLDTGDMLLTIRTAIGDKDAGTLTAELAQLGAAAMVRVLAEPGDFVPEPQPETGVTHAAKIRKEEAQLDFAHDAAALAAQVRAFAPAPGAWFAHGGERLRVLAATVEDGRGVPGTVVDDRLGIVCGTGVLRPTRVGRAGRAAMPAADLLRGLPLPAGTRLDGRAA